MTRGTIASPASTQIRTTAATSAVEAGRTTTCRAAIEPPRLDQIGLLVARIGDPAGGSDRFFDPP